MLLVTLVVVGHSWTLLPETPGSGPRPTTGCTSGTCRRSSWSPATSPAASPTAARTCAGWSPPWSSPTWSSRACSPCSGCTSAGRPSSAVAQPALADVVPHRAVLLAAGDPVLPAHRLPLPLAVAISLVGGVVGIETFDLSRVIGLLPFFVAGLLVEERHLAWLRRAGARGSRWPSSPPASLVTPWVEWGISTEWLYYRTAYADLSESWSRASAIRALLLVIGVRDGRVGALAWVPRGTGLVHPARCRQPRRLPLPRVRREGRRVRRLCPAGPTEHAALAFVRDHRRRRASWP